MQGLELGEIKLEGQRISGSGAAESCDIEKQHDRLPAQIIGQTDGLCRRGWE
jgi:hypothetical protein